ncbi:MAG: NAD(P)/FAD-dependent oxidoreductase [Acutalibacteraceae bacterium]
MDIFGIGGGYAAAEEAMYLTRYGKHVTMIIREPDFTCAKSIADKVKEHPDITIHYHTEIKKADGDDLLREATFINNQTGEEFTYTASEEDQTFGIFVFAGYEPATALFKNHIELDDYGYIPTDNNMNTNVHGVFAAGDLRPKALRQIVTAVADGAIAATAAERYVAEEKERLGIKDEEKVIKSKSTESAAASPAPSKTNTTPSEEAEESLWPAELIEQVRGILNALKQDVTLVTIVNSQN